MDGILPSEIQEFLQMCSTDELCTMARGADEDRELSDDQKALFIYLIYAELRSRRHARSQPTKHSLIPHLAAQLECDLKGLIQKGISLDRMSQTAQVGGVAGAGAALYFGHPVIALIAGGIALLAGDFTEEQKRIELNRVRLKWLGIANTLGSDGTRLLLRELGERHPGAVSGAQHLLLSG